MSTKSMKPIRFYAPIKRVDEAQREIEVYAFVNEVVEGEGGVRLLRSAMEAASADYMEWANVREMHQPSAIGIVRSMTWDATGARQIIHVVDNDAWDKVQAGVYKGASVGVLPTLVRGLDVTGCKWFETSLVDRPKDPDSKFLVVRADGMDDMTDDTVIEVTIVQEAPTVQDFASAMAVEQLWDKGYEAMDALWGVLIDIAYSSADNKADLIGNSIDQFKEFIVNHVAGGNLVAAKQRIMIALPSDTTPEMVAALRRSFRDPLPAEAPANVDPLAAPAAPAAVDPEITSEQIDRIVGNVTDTITREFGSIIPKFEGIPAVIQRLEQASTDYAAVRTDLEAVNSLVGTVIERIEKVEKSPAQLVVPVRFPQMMRNLSGAERHIGETETSPQTGEFKTRGEAEAEIKRLTGPEHVKMLVTTEAQMTTIQRVQEIRRAMDLLPD